MYGFSDEVELKYMIFSNRELEHELLLVGSHFISKHKDPKKDRKKVKILFPISFNYIILCSKYRILLLVFPTQVVILLYNIDKTL